MADTEMDVDAPASPVDHKNNQSSSGLDTRTGFTFTSVFICFHDERVYIFSFFFFLGFMGRLPSIPTLPFEKASDALHL
jgi:hypothetical protein